MTHDGEIDCLCGRLRLDQISRTQFIERCVRLAGHGIECSRSALWIFVDSASGRALRCVAMYDRNRDRMVQVDGHSTDSADHFYDELSKSGRVVAHDARIHPATHKFFGDHLRRGGVRSLIATPLSVNGKLFGAFACTQVDECVHWSVQHLILLRRISVRATLAMASTGPRETTQMTIGW
jgi:GAF domain-containing protein